MLAWAVKPQGWITRNAAAAVDAARVGAAGRRRLRRAYTPEEWRRLLAAAPPYRQTIYQVAAYSGLRRSEMRRLAETGLRPLRAAPPVEDPPGSDEEWGRGAAADAPGVCGRATAGVGGDPRPIEPRLPRRAVHRAITPGPRRRRHPAQDSRGRWADFHSFRYTFCTWMAARHPIQVVQRLMRHGTITLTTDIYNDLDLSDTAEQLWTLPPLAAEPFPTANPTTPVFRPDGL